MPGKLNFEGLELRDSGNTLSLLWNSGSVEAEPSRGLIPGACPVLSRGSMSGQDPMTAQPS